MYVQAFLNNPMNGGSLSTDLNPLNYFFMGEKNWIHHYVISYSISRFYSSNCFLNNTQRGVSPRNTMTHEDLTTFIQAIWGNALAKFNKSMKKEFVS